MIELNKLYLMDCMIGMKEFPDKYFDLAIVDPRYGIGMGASVNINSKTNFINKKWDLEIPNRKYFIELKRISINQIIWGGNYFPELWKNPCKDFIFWNKLNHHDNRSDGEFAWTSFNGLAKNFEYMWDGNRYGTHGNIKGVGKKTIRIHPTQKPVALYKWILNKYAKSDMKIIDTHAGSCSSVLAFLDFGCDWIAFEKDKDYYRDAMKRIENHKLQLKLKL